MAAAPDAAYFDALEGRLEAYALVGGAGEEPVRLLRALCRAHRAGMPPLEEWERHSALAPDGAPVEISETVGSGGVGLTVDPGPYNASSAARLDAALGILRPLWPEADAFAHALFGGMPATLAGDDGQVRTFTLWLGGDRAGLRVYGQLGGRDRGRVAMASAEAGLAAAGFTPGAAARRLWSCATDTHPRMLSLTLRDGRPVQAKLYLRATHPPFASAFRPYLRSLLGVTGTWNDPNTGVGIALAPGGGLVGCGIYHYAAPYFADDEALRRRLTAVGPELGLDVGPWRRASRVMAAPPGQRWRGMIGYGLSADGARARMKVYVRTGALMPRRTVRRASAASTMRPANDPILDRRATC